MTTGDIVRAYEMLISLNGYKDSAEKASSIYDMYVLEKYKKGNYIEFGSYEQDNDMSNGKEEIEWLVLDVVDGKVLLVSKYALDTKQYDAGETDMTWEKSMLRTWLNSEFYYSAFSDEEKAKLCRVTVSADRNLYHDTDQGYATNDQIFLLSIPEVSAYLSDKDSRWCKPTAFAKANGAYTDFRGYCCWWLRSMGENPYKASFVDQFGGLNRDGDSVYRNDVAIRPAIWIDLNV